MAAAVKGANLEGMDLPEAKKKYILEKVNPLLEELVRAVLTRMPDEPLAFMIKFLKEKTGRANVDLEAVTKENFLLEQEIQQMELKLKDATSKAAEILNQEGKKAVDDEEEEEEEDDYVDEIPEEYQQSTATNSRMRTSVSAEAYGEWNKKKEFKPPKHPKSDVQRKRISDVLSKNFLFSSLDEQQANIILDAVEEVIIPKDQRIINQGDEGNFMFVIESGALECYIKKDDGSELMVKTVEAGDAFGELALLYNAPRAASVQAKDRCVCWKLDRETFNAIVKDAAQQKRDKYMEFFKNVPLLNAVDAYGRSQIADALTKKTVKKGDAEIITQGEVGDAFYIIEEGECMAKKVNESGEKVNMALKAGDYFGELALLSGEPRAASVEATSETVKLLCLDRKAFSRLLGPLREMLMQGQNR